MAIKLGDYKTGVHNDWCPGCGDFGIVNAIQMSLAEMQIPKHKTAIFLWNWLFWEDITFHQYLRRSYSTW